MGCGASLRGGLPHGGCRTASPCKLPLFLATWVCLACLPQRWEFFIGDPPQPEEQPGQGEGAEAPQAPLPPIAQLAAAEQYAVSGQFSACMLRLTAA